MIKVENRQIRNIAGNKNTSMLVVRIEIGRDTIRTRGTGSRTVFLDLKIACLRVHPPITTEVSLS